MDLLMLHPAAKCIVCQTPLERLRRQDTNYCSDACRQYAYRQRRKENKRTPR